MKAFANSLSLALLGALVTLAGAAVAQQAYPSKPIRIIVPYPPGGAMDPLARLVGPKLTDSWGQPVIVDNRPGGNSVIGTEAVAKSTPDGYTILIMGPGHIITPLLMPTPYDAIKDFAPVVTLAGYPFVLLLNPSLPANTLQEFIALAKSSPGKFNFGSAGVGSIGHLGGKLLNNAVGINMQHIGYKGTGQALTDVIGGQLQVLFSPPLIAIQHIKSGKLRAIAIGGDKRLSALPQVPTFTEAGLPGFEVKTWIGVVARAGSPKPVIDKLATEITRIVATQDFKERLDNQGLETFISTPEQFAALMKADTLMWSNLIKAENIKAEH